MAGYIKFLILKLPVLTNLFDNKAQHLIVICFIYLSALSTDLLSGMNDLGFSKD